MDHIEVISTATTRQDIPLGTVNLRLSFRLEGAIGVKPARPKLSRKPRILTRGGIIHSAWVGAGAMTESTKEPRHLQPTLQGTGRNMIKIGVALDHSPALRMLILQLNHDDITAAMNLVAGGYGHDFIKPIVIPFEEFGVGRADIHIRFEFEPEGPAAIFPFRANVGSDAQNCI